MTSQPGPPGTKLFWQRIKRPVSSQTCESLPQPSDNLQCSPWCCWAALHPQKVQLCQGPELGLLQMPKQEMKPSGGIHRAGCQCLHKGILLRRDFGIRALQHDSSWCRGLTREWINDWGGDTTRSWDLAFRHGVCTFLLCLVYLPYGVFRGPVTRRGVSKERWREKAGFGVVQGEPSDASSSIPNFLHVSSTALMRGPYLLPPASNWLWGNDDTSQGRNNDQTYLTC